MAIGGTQAGVPGELRPRSVDAGRLEVGRLALEESRRKYEQVERQLEATRARVLSVLGFASAGIAFLAGAVVTNASLSTGAKWWALAGTVGYALFVGCGLWIVWPVSGWRRGLEAQQITEKFVDAQVGGRPEEAYKEVASLVSEDATWNRQLADRVLARVPILIALCGIAQGLWLIAVWVS